MRSKFKRKVNPQEPIISRNHEIGERVYGCRHPKAYIGTFVRAYATINTNNSGTHRNPAYVVKCDCDGKERSFQFIRSLVKDGLYDPAISIGNTFEVR